MKYKYEILNYWKDLCDLYVNYTVEDLESHKKVNTITLYNPYELPFDYDTASNTEIKEILVKNLQTNNGVEFNLPKISKCSKLLKYVYDSVCESEQNMYHINYYEWKKFNQEHVFCEEDITTLKQEIDKYNLDELLVVDDGKYKIVGYGCLQTKFNNDREKVSDEFER